MSFAIMRFSKLKTKGNIAASLSHNYRTRETLNADPSRAASNEHSLDSADSVTDSINARLPPKYPSNAVMCVEFLITASPDWKGWNTADEVAFFDKSRKWLEDQYGAKNVIATTIHRDETTPHLVAYIVPIDEQTGRLNAHKWTGGKVKLRQMQSDFAASVADLGLTRGIEGSEATHQSIRKYYSKANKHQSDIHDSLVEQKDMYDRFTDDTVKIGKLVRSLDPNDTNAYRQKTMEISNMAESMADEFCSQSIRVDREIKRNRSAKPTVPTPSPTIRPKDEPDYSP